MFKNEYPFKRWYQIIVKYLGFILALIPFVVMWILQNVIGQIDLTTMMILLALVPILSFSWYVILIMYFVPIYQIRNYNYDYLKAYMNAFDSYTIVPNFPPKDSKLKGQMIEKMYQDISYFTLKQKIPFMNRFMGYISDKYVDFVFLDQWNINIIKYEKQNCNNDLIIVYRSDNDSNYSVDFDSNRDVHYINIQSKEGLLYLQSIFYLHTSEKENHKFRKYIKEKNIIFDIYRTRYIMKILYTYLGIPKYKATLYKNIFASLYNADILSGQPRHL